MIDVVPVSDDEVTKILQLSENHFCDFKSIRIQPNKLTKSLSGFSNAEGGELYIGIEDTPRVWSGFANEEAANGHIQALEDLFPLGYGYNYTFLSGEKQSGLVLKIEVLKSSEIKTASGGIAYVRRSAQNLPCTSEEALDRLRKNKGITSFETELVNVESDIISNSIHIIEFMLEVIPAAEPEQWLRKQRLIIDGKPTVAGILLFSDEPQAVLPKQCGIKLYQYSSSDEEGERDSLVFDPISIEGCVYDLIHTAVKKTKEIIEAIQIMTPEGLKRAKYPIEALHEIITNAVIHRDYSITDDIHVRIFDNRVEVQSPGKLPGHITVENILTERFSRNGAIVRLINKFPNPPNKDVGEGLNTAFEAMKKVRLKQPEIIQRDMSVLVVLKHEPIATPQSLIMEYLENHETITNKQARDITGSSGSENAMKHTLKRMVEAGMLEVVPGKTVFQTSYKKAEK